jgi:hypothetical protein
MATSVRSAYRLALAADPNQCNMTASSTYPDGKHPCWAKIWQSSVPPKVKIFAWKAASGALATEDNKKRHHLLVRGRCKICDPEKEDVAHALYNCPHDFALWKEMRQVWCLPRNKELKTPSSNWFQSVLLQIPRRMVDTNLLVAWRAWYARSKVTHDKKLPTVASSKVFL